MVLAGLNLGLSRSVPDHDAGVVGLSTSKYEVFLFHMTSLSLNCHAR
jgi:hypothetical protein